MRPAATKTYRPRCARAPKERYPPTSHSHCNFSHFLSLGKTGTFWRLVAAVGRRNGAALRELIVGRRPKLECSSCCAQCASACPTKRHPANTDDELCEGPVGSRRAERHRLPMGAQRFCERHLGTGFLFTASPARLGRDFADVESRPASASS